MSKRSSMQHHPIIAFFVGVVFALGLGVSGMTDPARVQGFLDVAGAWNPSLMLVMVGAIAVHLAGYRLLVRRRVRPLFGERFALPSLRTVDRRLLAGAALFGVGWGLAGLCPGPALVSLVTASSSIAIFVAMMLVGMGLHSAVHRRRGS
ncbi:MAG: YeeE/YedE family protein [Nannocystaceae bacterium]